MANFFYTAKSLDGATKTGTIDAQDIKEVAQILKKQGLFLAKIYPQIKKEKTKLGFSLSLRRVSLTEKMLMTRNLAVIVSTGLPLVKGFSILAAQAKSKRMKEVLLAVAQEVSRGRGLSESLKKFPDVFSELFVSMIASGEESGTLEDVLKVLSLQLERENEMKSKVAKALVYPCVLVATMIIVAIFLSIFVLPKINTFFTSFQAQLPITTVIILGSGDFLIKYWYYLALAILLLIFVLATALKTKLGRIFIDTISLKIPFISSLIKKSNSASLIRSMSSLLSSGVPLTRSLEITAGNVGNFYFKKAALGACKEIQMGKKLFVSLQPYQNIFPYGVVEMIEIGEETGKTSLILKKLAEFYEQEVAGAAENLSVIIEPVLIVIMGIAVGVFAVSIIGPLYSILGNI